MEMLELCRLCALEKDNLLGIFDSEGLRLTLDLKIKKCLNIEVTHKESYPKSICMDCFAKLDAFDEFLDLSINAQATLSILYPDKPRKIESFQLSDEECPDGKTQPEDNFNDHDDAFMLDEVQPHEALGLGKPVFMDADKTFVDSAAEVLDHCEDTAMAAGMPPAEIPFFPEKTEADEGSDVEAKDPLAKEWECPCDIETKDPLSKDWGRPTTWLCSDCSEQFGDVGDLRQHHRDEHSQDARYMCGYCSKLFIDFQVFLTHCRRHRNSLKYCCETCGKVFSNKKIMDAHRMTHSNSKPYECSQCGKSFRQQSSLFLHSRCHLPDVIKNKYPCDMCDKRFSTKPNLMTHMRIHSGVRNFTCDQCGKSFIQKGNLDAHFLTHSHDKPFNCDHCNKRFKTGMQLRKHHSVHTGAKPHKCDVCGRTFREKGTLREHHRIHTGAMPFTCEYCGKAFRFKGILTTHRRQHTGERPYSCVECQHHFTNWPNYNKHMKRRHGINTSRSTRSDKSATAVGPVPAASPVQQPTQQPQQIPQAAPIYQEIQQSDLYANIQTPNLSSTMPTYMAYNVYSLSQVPGLDGTTIELMPRQTITLKEATGNTLDFQS